MRRWKAPPRAEDGPSAERAEEVVIMPVRKIARIVDAAYKDADLARMKASDPEFRREVTKDRRSTLSSFKTVKHALADRERIEKKTAAARKAPKKKK